MSRAPNTDIRLREAIAADAEFIYRVVETTMRGYVEQTWGTFSEETNRENIAKLIASRNYSIIEANGTDAGVFAVEREETHIQLAQIFILPAHQNRGIGTTLVRKLIAEASAAGKPLRLRVLSVNPARRLYEREGFRATWITPQRYYMERSPIP